MLVLRAAGLAVTLGLQVLLARMLGVDGFGVYTYAFALLSLGLLPSKWGWDLAAVRYLPAMDPPEDAGRAFVRTAIGRSLLYGAAVGAAWMALDLVFGIDELAAEPLWLLAAAATMPAFAVLRVAEGCLRGAQRVLIAYAPFALLWPAVFALSALWLEPWHEGSTGRILFLQFLSMAVVTAGSVGFLWHAVRGDAVPSDSQRRQWRQTARNLALTSGIAYVMTQLGMVIIGIFGGAEMAGTYAAAWRLGLVAAGFLVAFSFAFGPMASRLLAQGRRDDLQRLLNRTTAILSAIAAVTFAAGFVFAEPLIDLFGEGFSEAVVPLRILLFAQCFNAACGPVTPLLNVSGHERKTLVVLIPALVLTVVGSIVFASAGSLVGVAATSAVVVVLWNVGLVIQVHRYLGLRTITALLPRRRR